VGSVAEVQSTWGWRSSQWRFYSTVLYNYCGRSYNV